MQTRWLWSLVVVSSLVACSDASSSRTGSVSPTGAAGAGAAGSSGGSGQPGAGQAGLSGHAGAGQAGTSGNSGQSGAGQGGISGSSGHGGASQAGSSGTSGQTGTSGQAGTGAAGAPALCEPGIPPSKGACTIGASFPYLCNPFTADPCDPGQECTLATWDYDYECTAHFGDLPLCAPCDASDQYGDSDKTCVAGSWCHQGTCQRLCCDDGDCASGHCQLESGYPHNDVVGFCQVD